MGYEENRFSVKIEGQYICSICSDVVENPLALTKCQHLHCSLCIIDWIKYSKTCPLDREEVEMNDLIQPTEEITNYLNNLDIKCRFASIGCNDSCKLRDIENHERCCSYNSDALIRCVCTQYINNDEYDDHISNCTAYQDTDDQSFEIIQQNDVPNTENENEVLMRSAIKNIRDAIDDLDKVEKNSENNGNNSNNGGNENNGNNGNNSENANNANNGNNGNREPYSFLRHIQMSLRRALSTLINEFKRYKTWLHIYGGVGAIGGAIGAYMFLTPAGWLAIGGCVIGGAVLGWICGAIVGYALIKCKQLLEECLQSFRTSRPHQH